MKFFMFNRMFMMPLFMMGFILIVGIIIIRKYGGLKNLIAAIVNGKNALEKDHNLKENNTSKPENDIITILNERYAKGEISKQEFLEMKENLS